MAATATAQVNVRINAKLKEEGDRALASAGLTPSKAVRSLWELAARYKNAPDKLQAALYPDLARAQQEAADRKRGQVDALIQQGPAIFDEACRAVGASPADSSLNLPLHDLKAAAYAEEYGQDVLDD